MAASFWLGAQTCYAQDSDESQLKQEENEVLDLLSRNPATAMDVGLLGLRQTEIVTFLANKPQIFKQESFNHLEVSYSSVAQVIFIEVSYRTETENEEAMVADCKNSLELAISPLVRSVSNEVSGIVGADNARSLVCKANSYFYNKSIPRVQELQITSPAWNICDSIRVVVTVLREHGAITCRKDVPDKDIVVIRN